MKKYVLEDYIGTSIRIHFIIPCEREVSEVEVEGLGFTCIFLSGTASHSMSSRVQVLWAKIASSGR